MLPIIYVHIGNKPAPHLIESIGQSRRMARRAPIYVVLSRNTAMSAEASAAGAMVVYSDDLTPTGEHEIFRRSVRRRLGKKRGFWRFATERFFLIEELMRKLEMPSALHLESDNLIFFDPAEIESRLRSLYPGLAAPFLNDDLCIPGVVYAGSVSSLSQLNRYIAERVAAERLTNRKRHIPFFMRRVRMGIKLHDMNLLADFRRHYGSLALGILPMVPPDYEAGVKANPSRAIPKQYCYSHGFSEISMIFDASAIGNFMFGLDPILPNAEHSKGMTNPLSIVDGADFGYDLIDFREPTAVPHLTYRGRKIRLASIHNHAKARIFPEASKAT